MSLPAAAGGLVVAVQAHAAALAAIHLAAFPPGEAWPEPAFAAQLALPGTFGWMERRGGLVLARNAADEAEILTLGVAPAARRRGVGAALLQVALQEAARRGAAAMFLEVSERNLPALALYGAAGFGRVGRRRRYYADGADALVLRRPLSGEAAS